jgi:molybdenum cofactor cytidylyltransferase
MIVGILLAAGASLRMGRDKLGLPWRGSTVLESTLGRWVAVPQLDEILVVRRPGGTPISIPRVRTLENAEADEGMGSSLRLAAQALPPDTEAAVVGLADMPEVASDTIAALVKAWRPLGPAGIVAPAFEGRRGHPVVFGAAHFPALQRLGGDSGARDILRERASDLRLLDVQDPGVLLDIDRPSDLEGPS